MDIVFFGSFQHYSALILQSLIDAPDIHVVAVVTTPPAPVGRKQIITKTPVHLLADHHSIPVFTPDKLEASMLSNDARSRTQLAGVEDVDLRHALPTIPKPDFFVTAGYGKILPHSWLEYPKLASLNLHFSLLPAYRGANPAEWAIMCGETQTGITLMIMNHKLDAGDILAQAKIPIDPTDTRETLYHKLYQLGAHKLSQWLIDGEKSGFFSTQPDPTKWERVLQKTDFEPKTQPAKSPTPYAALLKRDDGFLPWSTIQKFLHHQPLAPSDFPSIHLQTAFEYTADKTNFIKRLPRALAGYPSLWTIVPTHKGDKRMKIINFDPFTVQIEGKQPSLFNQIKNQILNS